MKADSLHMGKVFSSGGDVHYVLPHFQREYAWDKSEWQTLINDIMSIYDLYEEANPPEHFMGTLVVINDGTQAGTVPVFRLVDGQQRLTTISLLFCALANLLKDDKDSTSLHRKLRAMLVNQYESGVLRYKLLPTVKYGDRASYTALVDGEQPPKKVESRIPAAYAFLSEQIAERIEAKQLDPNRLFVILVTCLQIVFINLDRGERPYEIFESLNYKGKSLTQADLVRNYIAMKLPPDRQETAFTKLWSPIEETLLEKRTVGRSGLGELTAFLRHYFAHLSGILINENHVYSRFRDRGEKLSVVEFEQELETLKRMAGYYDKLLRPENESDVAVRNQLVRLNRLESSTAYPFFLYLYDQLAQQAITRDDMLNALRLLECYLVRRFLARESTNYNRFFPPLVKEVDPNQIVDSLRKALSTKQEPSDAKLRQSAEQSVLYRRSAFVHQRLTLVFETINRHLSAQSGGYTVLDDKPTIEHIMPQSPKDDWKQHLGANWEQDYELLHTIGNLTIVAQDWNSAMSNLPYESKRAKLKGHALRINSDYFSTNTPEIWNADAIRARASWLIEIAIKIWPQIGSVAPEADQKPREVVIMGQIYPVASWRDVLRRTADVVAKLHEADFKMRIVPAAASYFSQQPGGVAPHQLPNGWYIQIHHNADKIKQLCEAIVDASVIDPDEYEIVLW